MARQSLISTMSPAGTVLSAPSTVSNVINTSSIRDGRVYVEIEALVGATTIDVEAQIAEENTAAKFVTVKTVANPFTAASMSIFALLHARSNSAAVGYRRPASHSATGLLVYPSRRANWI